MADCYYHGYSGGPGACPECEYERRHGLEQGSTDKPLDERMTQEELMARELGITLEQFRKGEYRGGKKK